MPTMNARDPSGLRTTEDRRAAELARDYDAMVKAVLQRVAAGEITDPTLISEIVAEECARYSTLQQAKVIKWAQDSASKATIRAVQQVKRAGVTVPVTLGPQPIPEDVRKVLTANITNEIESLSTDARKVIVRELTDGITAGEGMDDLRRRLQSATAMDKNRADLIARTETMDAFNLAARSTYKKHGAIGVRIFTAQDERRCKYCGAMHGKVLDITDPRRPPFHPRCRCVEEPVFSEEEAAEDWEHFVSFEAIEAGIIKVMA